MTSEVLINGTVFTCYYEVNTDIDIILTDVYIANQEVKWLTDRANISDVIIARLHKQHVKKNG